MRGNCCITNLYVGWNCSCSTKEILTAPTTLFQSIKVFRDSLTGKGQYIFAASWECQMEIQPPVTSQGSAQMIALSDQLVCLASES